ncbi:unnamed protein product [Cylicocyclus nassatus]|uniref:Uncharacterized protein n=1 Tax=Cylicocyclus nassatus TaxID=53992 RepID=A0AA36GK76_CYLNA|nr:unnamed protein product [Cylicocyclus nassatus]
MSMIGEELTYFAPGLFYQWIIGPAVHVSVHHITVNVLEFLIPGKFFVRSNDHPQRLFGPFHAEPTGDLLPARGDCLVFQNFGWVCDFFYLNECVRHIIN